MEGYRYQQLAYLIVPLISGIEFFRNARFMRIRPGKESARAVTLDACGYGFIAFIPAIFLFTIFSLEYKRFPLLEQRPSPVRPLRRDVPVPRVLVAGLPDHGAQGKADGEAGRFDVALRLGAVPGAGLLHLCAYPLGGAVQSHVGVGLLVRGELAAFWPA